VPQKQLSHMRTLNSHDIVFTHRVTAPDKEGMSFTFCSLKDDKLTWRKPVIAPTGFTVNYAINQQKYAYILTNPSPADSINTLILTIFDALTGTTFNRFTIKVAAILQHFYCDDEKRSIKFDNWQGTNISLFHSAKLAINLEVKKIREEPVYEKNQFILFGPIPFHLREPFSTKIEEHKSFAPDNS
jgi:hypothetical protein